MRKVLATIAALAFLASFVAMLNYRPTANEQAVQIVNLQKELNTTGAICGRLGDSSCRLIAKYTSDGTTFQLVYDLRYQHLTVRMPAGNRYSMDILAREVMKLTNNTHSLKFGGAFSFVYDGGFPEWAPHKQYYAEEGDWDALMFARGVILDDKIIARGLDERPTTYYPYPHRS